MSERRVALLGLPGTGKSSYLGTLWHIVEEPSMEEITEVDSTGDRAHLQELANYARRMKQIPRTRHDDDERFDVEVEFAQAGTGRMIIPDRSGEQLQALVENRTWPELLKTELDVAESLLLFVHPDTLQMPTDLHVVGKPDSSAPQEERPYEHGKACTSAQLIDGVENVLEAMQSRWPVRLGVVVSAFDQDAAERTPGEWLNERLPAIAAMLESDPARCLLAVFGVSALGGSRENADEVLGAGPLHMRAWARDSEGGSIPFTDPVRWALGWR